MSPKILPARSNVSTLINTRSNPPAMKGIGDTGPVRRTMSIKRPVSIPAAIAFVSLLSACTPAPRFLSHPAAREGAASEPALHPTVAPALDIRLSPPVENFSAERITSGFGRRPQPGSSEGAEEHQGIDIKARAGERVLAAAAGTVAFAGRQHGYGNIVIIDHGGGITTVYAHLFYACVRKGDPVGRGETIGRAGKRGSATGVHLHFEVRRGGVALDPQPYL